MKAFLIDINRCNGCYNCQLACKDEHCDQAWEGYAAAQPLIGQFWMHIKEKERGQVPKVRVSYVPTVFDHSDACDLPERFPGKVVRRDDGFILFDPEKCAGDEDLKEAVEGIEGVYYNDDLRIPQACTGCAHLIDNGWDVPRCVDACATEAIKFGELDDLDLEGAVQLSEGSHVYYKNYPKRFCAGLAFDAKAREVVIGADVELLLDGEIVAKTVTDDFGDYLFDQIEPDSYVVRVVAEGFEAVELCADVTDKDLYLGDTALA